MNLEVDPTITGFVGKAIILDEFVRDVSEVDAGVLKEIERVVEVEVADVKYSKAGIATRDNTVKDKLGKFKGAGWRVNIARVANTIANYGDAGVIGIVLVWLDFTHDFGVCNLFAAVTGNVVVCDDEECVVALDAWERAGGIFANTLTDAAKFVGVIFVPNVLVFRMCL